MQRIFSPSVRHWGCCFPIHVATIHIRARQRPAAYSVLYQWSRIWTAECPKFTRDSRQGLTGQRVSTSHCGGNYHLQLTSVQLWPICGSSWFDSYVFWPCPGPWGQVGHKQINTTRLAWIKLHIACALGLFALVSWAALPILQFGKMTDVQVHVATVFASTSLAPSTLNSNPKKAVSEVRSVS